MHRRILNSGFAILLIWHGIAGPCLAGEWQAIVTSDGRRLVGRVSSAGTAVLVQDGTRDIYLSPAIVRERGPVPAPVAEPVYEFHQDLAKAPKKGRIDPVVKGFARDIPDGAGIFPVSLVDPKLGPLQFRMALTHLTPRQYRLEGVEYAMSLEFPTASIHGFACERVAAATDDTSAESLLKATRFFRLAGNMASAQAMIRKLQALGGLPREAAEESRRIELEPLRLALAEIRRLLLCGKGEEAHWLFSTLTIPVTLNQADPDLDMAIDAVRERLNREAAAVEVVTERLRKGLPAAAWRPTPAQALRLQRLLRDAAAVGVALDPEWLPGLAQEWSELLAGSVLTRPQVEEAVALARATAGFFRQDQAKGLAELADHYRKSALPLAARVAILRHATAFDPSPAPVDWTKIEYTHPRSGKKYHYYVQLPSSYRADVPTPALLALHGQVTDASVMQRYWGPTAERYGLILISPEYIYGRESGYMMSQDEHEAVLGALWHASGRYNIDRDRTYLQGHSQGGHACWDIGAGHAGSFAGVLPVIGVPLIPALVPNYADTALYAIDGSKDGAAPAMNREAMRVLAGLRTDATYVEYPGRGHEAFYEEYDAAATWMFAHVRDRKPAALHLTGFLPCDGTRRWLRTSARGTVSATFAENRFNLTAKDIGPVTLFLSPDMVDFSRSVRVLLNGRPVHDRREEADWRFALETCFANRDRSEIFLGSLRVGGAR